MTHIHTLEAEYPKISAVRKRDPKTNKPTDAYADDIFDPDTGLGAMNWTFREKLDGTNLRILWDGHRVTVRGRTDNAQFSTPVHAFFNAGILSREFEEIIEQTFGATQVAIYAELVGPKVNGNRHKLEALEVRVFDIWVDGWWLLPENVNGAAESLGLGVAKIIGHCPLELAEEHARYAVAEGSTDEGLVGTPPGGVLSRAGRIIRVKVKLENYR